MVQKSFSPIKLPIDLTVRVTECGLSNAWYQRPTLTICYEYIDTDIMMVGQFIYTVSHEMGHALIDLLNVPLFGRPEDAADAFATYVLLRIGKSEARHLIRGAAYTYQNYLKQPRVNVSVTAFADDHGAPPQRFYNMLCIAYGAMPETFGDFIENGMLPKDRARGCKREFGELNYAFKQLITPYLDEAALQGALKQDWTRPWKSPGR